MIAEAGEAGISVDKMVEITTQDEIDSSLKWEMESTSTQTAGAFQSVSSPSLALLKQLLVVGDFEGAVVGKEVGRLWGCILVLYSKVVIRW